MAKFILFHSFSTVGRFSEELEEVRVTFGFLKRFLLPDSLVFKVGDVHFGRVGDLDSGCAGCCQVDKAPDGGGGGCLAAL